MIFDEIDTGISGKTALVVGHKLSEIANHRQILCITHLPQIAASGDDNFSIDKEISEGKSHTVITHLDEAGKLEMLARLISGAPNSSNALEAAKELVASVKK
jgi:DNA repair protein RecN